MSLHDVDKEGDATTSTCFRIFGMFVVKIEERWGLVWGSSDISWIQGLNERRREKGAWRACCSPPNNQYLAGVQFLKIQLEIILNLK